MVQVNQVNHSHCVCNDGIYIKECGVKSFDPNFKSTISRGDEEKGCLGNIWLKVKSFGWSIWEGIKSFFRFIFCIKTAEAAPVEEPTQYTKKKELLDETAKLTKLSSELNDLRTQLDVKIKDKIISQTERKKIADWWMGEFDKLDPDLQKEILLIDLQTSASVSKLKEIEEDPSQEAIDAVALKIYHLKGDGYNNSMRFIRELQIAKDAKNNNYDPISPQHLPFTLKLTHDKLMKKIQTTLEEAKNLEA